MFISNSKCFLRFQAKDIWIVLAEHLGQEKTKEKTHEVIFGNWVFILPEDCYWTNYLEKLFST